jgi:hypothetical protein
MDGEQTITFAPGIQGGTITLRGANGELPITTKGIEIVIDGGTGITIQTDPQSQQRYRLFYAYVGTTLSLNNLNLVGGSEAAGGGVLAFGDLYIQNCTISQCSATVSGGGVEFSGNYLSITNSTIANNSAPLGGGIDIEGGTAFISNTQILCNTATTAGGGIYTSDGPNDLGSTVTLDNSVVYQNNAGVQGGGICVGSGAVGPMSLTLQDNTQIQDNWCTDPTSQQGGGIYFGSGTITFNGAWIGDNTATQGNGMYRVQGTTKVVGPSGVTWYQNQEVVGP